MSHFYAYLSKMKYINRWGIMRNTKFENDMEHTAQVAMIAHGLCEIKNRLFEGNVDTQQALVYALYHETSEVMTGDLPTPIKYNNKEILEAFHRLEKSATEKIYSMLPKEIQPGFDDMFLDRNSYEYQIVKAADKISAYIKCIEEEKAGNREFVKAKESIQTAISQLMMEEVDYWMDHFAHSFGLTIDELN